jgi:catechol 2,3-dioxygenase-like lactoylglutathione lyase family enzyme
MKVYRISAVTLKIKDMGKSCNLYSRIPGFKLAYGGAADPFTTFEVGGSKMYVNLELLNDPSTNDVGIGSKQRDFGRIIFHTEDVDSLYRHMKNDRAISRAVSFETEPADAPWGERFFHMREPNGYQLSFASPILKDAESTVTKLSRRREGA